MYKKYGIQCNMHHEILHDRKKLKHEQYDSESQAKHDQFLDHFNCWPDFLPF